MKYPIFSNWITYKKVPRTGQYHIKNHITEEELMVSAEDMRFAKQLDGKTDPYALWPYMKKKEIDRRVEELDDSGLIRMDRGVLRLGAVSRIITIARLKDRKKNKAVYQTSNIFVMLFFLPVFIAGLYAVAVLFDNGYAAPTDSWIYDLYRHHTMPFLITALILGSIAGGIFHEFGHANACRAYGGKVLEYGVALDMFPGLYTLMVYSEKTTRMQKVQILLAGIETNLLIAGLALLFVILAPAYFQVWFVIGFVNAMMAMINMLAIEGLDGVKTMLLLVGMEESDYELIRSVLKSRRSRERLMRGGVNGWIKLIILYMIYYMNYLYLILIAVEILNWLGLLL